MSFDDLHMIYALAREIPTHGADLSRQIYPLCPTLGSIALSRLREKQLQSRIQAARSPPARPLTRRGAGVVERGGLENR